MIDNEKIVAITYAEYLSGYRVRLRFNDGKEQILNFESFLRHARHPMIRKYLDLEKFKRFSLEYGDLVWNDYELCFPIADLYAGNIEHHSTCYLEAYPDSLLKVAETGTAVS
jgi:hypothetical protein